MLDQLCKAQDDFRLIRQQYSRGEVTYQEMHDAAAALLKLRQEAEIKRYGKAKTKVNAQTIASFMRS